MLPLSFLWLGAEDPTAAPNRTANDLLRVDGTEFWFSEEGSSTYRAKSEKFANRIDHERHHVRDPQ